MRRYPKIHHVGHKETDDLFEEGTVYVQEKCDGACGRTSLERNFDQQYHTEDRDLVFGSRNVVYKNQEDETKQFADSIEYVRENVDLDCLREYDSNNEGIVLFGEYMEPHTIKGYDWETWKGTFVGFDIWSIGREKFLHPKKALDIIEDIGLPTSTLIDEFPVEEYTGFDDEDVPESHFGPVTAEGVVFKNPVTSTYAKHVREDFQEKNSKTFGKSKKHQESGAEKLSYQYITEQRIRKQVHKQYRGSDRDGLCMEMMGPSEDDPGLPERVIRDMADEESGNIFMKKNWNVDLHEFRSITSSRCAEVLRKMIAENQEI